MEITDSAVGGETTKKGETIMHHIYVYPEVLECNTLISFEVRRTHGTILRTKSAGALDLPNDTAAALLLLLTKFLGPSNGITFHIASTPEFNPPARVTTRR